MQQPEGARGGAGGSEPEGPNTRSPFLTSQRFLPLFLVQSLGAFNDNVFKNAFVALLTFSLIDKLDLQMSLTALSAVAAGIFILPFALFAPFAGQIADGFDKARMMQAVKLVEIVLMVIAAIAYHVQSVFLLYALLFLMGAQSAFFAPIKYGVLPRYLPADELVQGNGLMQSGTFLAILAGTIAGFQLMKTDLGVLLVSIAVITVAICGYIASRYAPPAPPASDERAHILPNFGLRLAPASAGGRLGAVAALSAASVLSILVYVFVGADSYIYEDRLALAFAAFVLCFAVYALWPSIDAAVEASRERPVVWRTILAISWFWFAAASFFTLTPVLAKETLQGNEDLATLLFASFSIGVAIGASLVSWLQQGRIQVGVAPWGALGIAFFSISLFLTLADYAPAEQDRGVAAFLSDPTGWLVMVNFIGLAICAGLFVTPLNAIYQHNAPPEAVGRVVAASNMLDSTLMAISSVVIIALSVMSLPPAAVMATIGGTGFFASLVVARWSPETRFGRAVLSFLPPRDGA